MSLREILQNIAENNNDVILCSGDKEFQASDLLTELPEPKLKRKAHMQPGLYIAEISDAGYMGSILYKIRRK